MGAFLLAYPKGYARKRVDTVNGMRTFCARISRKVELCDKQQKNTQVGVSFVGLPERIRTFDLQSRSLTRYPAVPRVEIVLSFCIIDLPYGKTFRVCCSGRGV